MKAKPDVKPKPESEEARERMKMAWTAADVMALRYREQRQSADRAWPIL